MKDRLIAEVLVSIDRELELLDSCEEVLSEIIEILTQKI